MPTGGAAVGRRDAGRRLTLLLLPVLEQRGQVWCERREEGVPSWLAAAWAFSVLNLCCRGLSSRLFPKKQIPCLGTAPQLPLQGQVPHRVLQRSPRFPAVPIYSPPSHQAHGALLRTPGACRGAGLVPEGREQCGPGHHAWAAAGPSCTHCAGQVPRLPRPFRLRSPFMTPSSPTSLSPRVSFCPVPATSPTDMPLLPRCLIQSPELL